MPNDERFDRIEHQIELLKIELHRIEQLMDVHVKNLDKRLKHLEER